MNKLILSIALLLPIFSFISCSESESQKETIIIKERQVESKENKGALERAAEKLDDEANKKIDKQIDKIGDDK